MEQKMTISSVVIKPLEIKFGQKTSELLFDEQNKQYLLGKNELESNEIIAILLTNTFCETKPQKEKFIIFNAVYYGHSISSYLKDGEVIVEGVCAENVKQFVKDVSMGIYYGTYEFDVPIIDPFIEGLLNRKQEKSIHYDPYRNIDDNKSVSWVAGWKMMEQVKGIH